MPHLPRESPGEAARLLRSRLFRFPGGTEGSPEIAGAGDTPLWDTPDTAARDYATIAGGPLPGEEPVNYGSARFQALRRMFLRQPTEAATRQREQVAEQEALSQQAFTRQRPEVAREITGERAFELEKAALPARTAGEFAVRASESKAKADLDALQRMLQAGLAPGSRIGARGVSLTTPRVAPQPRVPGAVQNRLSALRGQAAQAGPTRTRFGLPEFLGGRGLTYQEPTPQAAALEQSVSGALQGQNISPDAQALAQSLAREFPGASASQLLDIALQREGPDSDVSDADQQELFDALSLIIGR